MDNQGSAFGSNRIEAFSDGVFAISATLLVVSLEMPNSFKDLVGNLYGFVAFAFSFAMLILIWQAHYHLFRRYDLRDGTTIALNAVLLFVVLFYVYPLKFLATIFVGYAFRLRPAETGGVQLGSFGELAQLFAIYSAGFVLVFLCIALLYRHAARRAEQLALNAEQVFDAHTWCRHYLLYVALGIVSVALALTGTGIRFGAPGWVYCLLGPFSYAYGVRRQRTKQATIVTTVDHTP